jgi:phosphatidylglycerol lysyltransferase
MSNVSDDRERARKFVRRFGRDAVAWQGLDSVCQYWFADDACVAYVDTGSAWVAAGSPLCAEGRGAAVAKRFVAAAKERGRRACFFGVEHPEDLGTQPTVLLGEQPIFDPAQWPATVARHRRLREQLRRARAKGVRVRKVEPRELAEGGELRAAIDSIAVAWLRRRRLEPMGFVASVEPYRFADDHRYYLAERGDQPVAFTSLVPVPARHGWLVDDTLRRENAPNGTTELLLDAAVRDVAEAAFVSLGLAPLSGPVSPVLLAARAIGAPLYDFRSLHAFKQRLHPTSWERVWLVHSPRQRVIAVLDTLRAFARGSLFAFGIRSILRHPSGLPWLVASALVPWTVLLASVAAFDGGTLFGLTQSALCALVLWDALLAVLMFRVARRPRPRALAWLCGAAAFDAAFSIVHILQAGVGDGLATAALRMAGVVAPIGATLALAWATRLAGAAYPPKHLALGCCRGLGS